MYKVVRLATFLYTSAIGRYSLTLSIDNSTSAPLSLNEHYVRNGKPRLSEIFRGNYSLYSRPCGLRLLKACVLRISCDWLRNVKWLTTENLYLTTECHVVTCECHVITYECHVVTCECHVITTEVTWMSWCQWIASMMFTVSNDD